MSVVGVIADTHIPHCHPLYLDFIQDEFSYWGVDTVVHIGDVCDQTALSFWEKDPDLPSAHDEAEAAAAELEQWKRVFPVAKVCIGNHCARHFRTARKAGLPERYLRSYAEVFDTPKWAWEFSHTIDGVVYEHGTGTSGKDAAFNRACQKRISLVMGHVHTHGGVKFHANESSIIFGLAVGCGIDIRSLAFSYGRDFPIRPILGCGIVKDGWFPQFIPMPCAPGEPYHRSKAGKKRLGVLRKVA